MDSFDRNRKCPECNSAIMATYEFHDGGSHSGAGIGEPQSTTRCPTDEPHMHRVCLVCGHEWAEAPSAEAESNA